MQKHSLSLNLSEFPTVYDVRPWGSFTVLDEGLNYKVKRIEVLPGKRLSYQRHQRRAEHWFIVKGEGTVTLALQQVKVIAGNTVDVPTGIAHRIENTGEELLVFIETQTGEYFGEDDIERLADDYQRF